MVNATGSNPLLPPITGLHNVVDKENEKVTFSHIDRYHHEWFTDYEIDLKNGKIKALDS